MIDEERAKYLLLGAECKNCVYINSSNPVGTKCILLGTKHYTHDKTIDSFCDKYVHISVGDKFFCPPLHTYSDVDNYVKLVEENK